MVEHFLVSHWGNQAESVTLSGLDVHDGGSWQLKPSPPDAWCQGTMERWLWWRQGRWRRWQWWGRGESGGSEERCLPQGDGRPGSNRCFQTGKKSALVAVKCPSPFVFTLKQSTRDTLCYIQVTSVNRLPPNPHSKVIQTPAAALKYNVWLFFFLFSHWQFPSVGVKSVSSKAACKLKEFSRDLGVGSKNVRVSFKLTYARSFLLAHSPCSTVA